MRVLLGFALLACLGWAAGARGAPPGRINLAWDACGSGGVTNKDFMCNTNQGTAVFVVSYTPPEVPWDLVGIEADVIIQPPGDSPLPFWWHLESSGCRPNSGTLSYNRGSDTLCAEYTSGLQINSWGYWLGYDTPNSASLTVSVGAGPPGIPVTQGVEYFGFRFAIDYAKSTGADSCGGCSDRLTLILDHVVFRGMQAYVWSNSPLRQSVIAWQGSLVPVRNATWGQIKGLYR